MSTDFLNIAGIFKTNTDLFKMTIQGIPPDRWFDRPGDDSNHLMWVAGHIVVHRGHVLKNLGTEWSVPWEGNFVRGGKLVASDQYPATEEVARAWDDVSGKLSTTLASVSDEILGQPGSKGIPAFDGKISGTIAFLALHESYHMGQMAYLRKWLGFGQTVG